MTKYRVNHEWRGELDQAYTVLQRGTEVDLDDEQAAWLNRDSPGLLSRPSPRSSKKQTGAGEGS